MTLDNVITILVSLVVGAGASYITFRLQFERFKAMDERRELDWISWRNKVDKDVDLLKTSASVTQLALLAQTVTALVKRVEDLWQYTTDLKHLHIDPFEREVTKLRASVDQMEKS